MNRCAKLLLLACLLAAPVRAAEYDECDAGFIAFLGADAYQFSPAHEGDLGRVRLYTILSNQKAAAFGDYGSAFWRLEIRNEAGGLVRAATGRARIDGGGQAQAEFTWDGRDDQGRLVPPGKYRYTFLGRFAPDAIRLALPAREYGDLRNISGISEAYASTDEVVVNYSLTEDQSIRLRQSTALGSCQAQQNTPIESGFGYNYYYGSTHSHSNWSDGGQPTTGCSSGNAYGSGNFDPTAVFDYARNSAGLDYWLVNEHNHLINDAMTTNNPPVTETKVKQRYAAGLTAANTATVNDVFIALYGMEWGVTTNGDQGHVTLIETPKLFGWETCSTCNGPNAECTAGTNCYFDIFTPKRFGYLTMYKRSTENPSSAGALGILCHPSTGEFDNYAFNADADAALQGIAVRSGLAFSTTTTCSDANVASTDYSARWKEALNKGFHLGPVADHDAHCNNYGVGIPNRTVYLIPNGATPVLTKSKLLQAHKARHFFATEDSNAQLVFTATGGKIMGDIFSASGSVTLRAAVYDPGAESVSTLEVWRGQIGGGVPASAYRTASASTLSFTETLSSGTYYYYVHAVQADGHDLWSAPMWITYGPGGGGSINVGGWKLTQLNATFNYTIPTGTTIPDNGYLVIGRDATKAAFESFWGALPAGVVYLNSAGVLPQINGSETYDLYNASSTLVDGRTIAMGSSGGSSIQRKDPCLAANLSSSWNVLASSSGNPGSGAAAGCAKGVVINEFSDALGTGNFIYEFVELHYDK
ncbi:MAG: hypothetical protein ABUT39_21285 [Acidobacteriota bacterium]